MGKTASFIMIGFSMLITMAMNGCSSIAEVLKESSTPDTEAAEPEVADAEVEVIVDKVERAGSEHDPLLLNIHLTIGRVEKDAHLFPIGPTLESRNSSLFDAEGNEYKLVTEKWGKVRDLGKGSSRSRGPDTIELQEGSTGLLVFRLPKDKKPAKLRFVRPLKWTWEEKIAKIVQMDIDLSNE